MQPDSILSPKLLSDYCATAILAVDPADGRIVAANPACETLLGYPVSALLTMQISDIEVGLQDVFFWEDVRQSGAQEISRVEGEYQHCSGHFLQVRKTIRLVQEAGRTLCIISAHDISASKRLEEESERTSSLLATTLESTIDGILVTDLNGKVLNFNHKLSEICACPAIENNDFHDLMNSFKSRLLEKERFERWIARLFHDPYLNELQTFNLDDGRAYEIGSAPQQYRDGPIGRLFCLHDISALKASEAELRIARDQAQQASKAKSDFLAHMSHELRTPLNAILGFAQIIETDENPEQQQLGTYIYRAGKHLLDLINEVLDLASIEAGKLALRMEPVALKTCIADCLEMTQLLARDKGVHLQAQLLADDVFVLADVRRLKQMLLNLVSNAIKYNRPNGEVMISVERSPGNNWRISISDTGIGISEQDQAQLFTAFNRVGNTQTSIEGTGIGLAFTQKLAWLMQGNIGVKSQPDVGSCFWIDLPASCAPQAGPTLPPFVIDQSSRSILYIEDDLLSQKLMQNILAKQRPQYQLFIAGSAEEGIALAQQFEPDLILLDQNLPDGTGAMVFEQLQQNERLYHTPCIALSGNTLPEQINDALRQGFCAYLGKPIQISSTLLTIDRWVSQKRERQVSSSSQ
ncbi:ATP-binding protein [Chitinibacter sp. S2-10]|uniref:PAS domain-containing hybrid sensor histidine kinase/response regulator n=1 Tax=Chitinibacter sp. S2-10 TaxID=3373597 RepID=UPI0039773DB9